MSSRFEVDSILGNIERLRERFQKITNSQEATVFASELQFVQRIIERQQTEAERLETIKYSINISLDQIQQQIQDWNKPDAATTNLDRTLRTINKILSTPNDLIFFDDDEGKAPKRPPRGSNINAHYATAKRNSLRDPTPTSSSLKSSQPISIAESSPPSSSSPTSTPATSVTNNNGKDSSESSKDLSTKEPAEKEKKSWGMKNIISRMQRSSTVTTSKDGKQQMYSGNSPVEHVKSADSLDATRSSNDVSTSYDQNGDSSSSSLSSHNNHNDSSSFASRGRALSVSASAGSSVKSYVDAQARRDHDVSSTSPPNSSSPQARTGSSGKVNKQLREASIGTSKTKALIELFSKIELPDNNNNGSPLLGKSPSMASTSDISVKNATHSISTTAVASSNYDEDTTSSQSSFDAEDGGNPLMSSTSTSSLSGMTSSSSQLPGTSTTTATSSSSLNNVGTPYNIAKGEINWGQLLANVKDDIDPKTKEQIEQLIKDKGIGNIAVTTEKKRQFFKIMGVSDNSDSSANKKREKQRKKWRKDLTKGSFEKKGRNGNLNNEEIDFLIELAKDNSPPSDDDYDLKKLACIALASGSYPTETVPGLRKRILEAELLQAFIQYAIEGELSVHNEVNPAEVDIVQQLAKGASAKVFIAKWKGKEVALKFFDPEHISFSIEEFRRELAMFCIIQHENLLPCFGASTKNVNSLFIITELMNKGGLNDFLKEMNEFVDFTGTLRFALDISNGMKYLHSLNIIHRDLKSLNILINNELRCKIIDFGTSRVVDSERNMTGNLGTPAWIAPEILTASKYTEKADVYSFGIVLWELITGQEPFKDMQIYAIPAAVLNGKRPAIPKDCNEHYRQIMEACWSENPDKRPTFEMLVKVFQAMLQSFDEEGNYIEGKVNLKLT